MTRGTAHVEATHCPSEGNARQNTDGQIFKTSYQGTVRPNLEYSSSALATTAKDKLLSLDTTRHYSLSQEP